MQAPEDTPLVLASASPRRRELLAAAGIRFELAPVDVDEDLAAFHDPAEAALELARRKALAAARARLERGRNARCVVLAADTVVALAQDGAWRLLGKPEDAEEAREMLRALGGSRHQVITGVCAARTPDLALRCGAERTWVRMRPIASEEVEAYVASGEWRGKAGGYAIQESADRFVTALEGGGFDNVVGLPVALAMNLVEELRRSPAAPA